MSAEVLDVGSGHLVAGELFFDEAVERFIGVERTDDVVAVVIGPGADRVSVGISVAVGVAGEVEPVAAPVFAISG